jgi:hypothetical protein
MTAGSKRLRNHREEAYAQERSLGYRPFECARRLGMNPRTGITSRYEKKSTIQSRIAYLRRSDITEELLAARRAHIEERLSAAAYGNIFEFAALDAHGNPRIDWHKVMNSELAVTINEFSFDADTGVLTKFKRDDALNAVAQLRDMHGFKAPIKNAVTDAKGADISLAQLIAESMKARKVEAPHEPSRRVRLDSVRAVDADGDE